MEPLFLGCLFTAELGHYFYWQKEMIQAVLKACLLPGPKLVPVTYYLNEVLVEQKDKQN